MVDALSTYKEKQIDRIHTEDMRLGRTVPSQCKHIGESLSVQSKVVDFIKGSHAPQGIQTNLSTHINKIA